MTVRYNIHLGTLSASTRDINDFMQSLAHSSVMNSITQTTFNRWKNNFYDYVDALASKPNPNSKYDLSYYHHLYEENAAGDPNSRLFEYVIPQSVRQTGRSELYANIDWIEAEEQQNVYGIRGEDPYALFNAHGGHVLRNKAELFETGAEYTPRYGYFVSKHGPKYPLVSPRGVKTLQFGKGRYKDRLSDTHDAYYAGPGQKEVKETVVDINTKALGIGRAKLERAIRSNNAGGRGGSLKQMHKDLEQAILSLIGDFK